MIWQAVQFSPAVDLGELFFQMIEYYSWHFCYESVIENGEEVKRLNLMDPLNPCNNMGGRQTDAELLHNMFRTVRYGFAQAQTEGEMLEYIFALHHLHS